MLDADILGIIMYVLHEEGYEVLGRTTGDNVPELIRNFNPSLILMDVLLGDYNGIQICKSLKKEPGTKKFPIILISGTHNLSENLHQEGAPDDFLAKPFNIPVLLEKVKRYLA